MKRVMTLLMATALLATNAEAHLPGTDGGPAEKGCRSVEGVSYVGATKISCRKARNLVRQAQRGPSHVNDHWSCTGERTSYGHCHNKDSRRKMAHWAGY